MLLRKLIQNFVVLVTPLYSSLSCILIWCITYLCCIKNFAIKNAKLYHFSCTGSLKMSLLTPIAPLCDEYFLRKLREMLLQRKLIWNFSFDHTLSLVYCFNVSHSYVTLRISPWKIKKKIIKHYNIDSLKHINLQIG